MIRRFIPFLLAAFVAALWLGAPMTHATVEAPDGTGETLIARHARYRSLIGVFPGQSGDHPGVLILEGPQGQTCGRMAVPMVGLIFDVRWDVEAVGLPGAGSIRRCVQRERLP